MRIAIRHIHVQPTHVVNSWLEQNLFEMGSQIHVDQANIVLEYNREESPGYRVEVHLVTPGPDVHATASDHTLRAAISKALEQIGTKITHRHLRRELRVKSNLQTTAHSKLNR